MYIARKQAISVLNEIIESGILKEYLEDALVDIVEIIKSEEHGLHLWGASDDAADFFVAYRTDLFTDELKAHLMELFNKYSFVPAPYEIEDIENDPSAGD